MNANSEIKHKKKSLGGKIVTGLLWGQIGMSLRSFICFIIYILISRSLNADDFGLYSALVSFIAILVYFTDMGIYSVFNNYLPRFASENKKGASSYLIRKTLLIKSVVFFFISLGIYRYTGLIADLTGVPGVRDYTLFLILWFLFRGISEFFIYILMSRMDMKYYAFAETLVSILQLTGVICLIKTKTDVASLVVLMAIVYGIQCVLYVYGSREAYLFKPENTELKPIVRYGLIIWLTTVIQYFLDKDIDIYMILYFLKDRSLVGFYNIAFLISSTGGYVLLSAVNSLSLTILSESYAKKGIRGLQKSLEFLYKISALLSAPIFAFMIFQAHNIITCLFSSKYADASVLLIIFSVFNLMASFLGGGYIITALLPLDKEKILLYLRCGGGILNLVLNLIFIPVFGIIGAVAATGVSFFVLVALELLIVIRLAEFKLPFQFIYKIVPVVVIPACLTLFLGETCLAGLILCALVYGLIVIKLTLTFNPLKAHELAMLEDLSPRAVNLMIKCRLLKQPSQVHGFDYD